jgi:hypothetical protein
LTKPATRPKVKSTSFRWQVSTGISGRFHRNIQYVDLLDNNSSIKLDIQNDDLSLLQSEIVDSAFGTNDIGYVTEDERFLFTNKEEFISGENFDSYIVGQLKENNPSISLTFIQSVLDMARNSRIAISSESLGLNLFMNNSNISEFEEILADEFDIEPNSIDLAIKAPTIGTMPFFTNKFAKDVYYITTSSDLYSNSFGVLAFDFERKVVTKYLLKAAVGYSPEYFYFDASKKEFYLISINQNELLGNNSDTSFWVFEKYTY